MLSKIRIRNYQSLRDITIEPGRLTIITGDSDVGKSAVVRAIKSVIINRSGQDFITHGQQSAGVAFAFDDGRAVAWQKAESATYQIVDNGKKDTFTKMGRLVPPEVLAILKMGEVAVGDEKLNINVHDQFDQPFLITATASLRARLLGELSGINLLYLAIQEARRREQSGKRTQLIRVSDLEQTKLRLQQFRHLPDVKLGLERAATELLEARELDSEIISLRTSIELLTESQSLAKSLAGKVVTLEKIAKLRPDIEKTLLELDALEKDIQLSDEVARRWVATGTAVERADGQLSDAITELAKFNICPTCGQPIPKGQLAKHAGVH